MKIIADMHTHTLTSHHAYSTLAENCTVARERGLSHIAMTNHAPAMLDAPSIAHFLALMPQYAKGIRVLGGAEVNILGDHTESSGLFADLFGDMGIDKWRKFGGNGFDLPDFCLSKLEYVIASIHDGCVIPTTVEEHTQLYLKALDNPHIDCLGHLGNPRFKADYEPIVQKCAKTGKIIEINSHSPVARKGSEPNCEIIAKLCIQYNVPVVVSTDAHYMDEIGDFTLSLALLEKVSFPEPLILNADLDRLRTWFKAKKGIEI